MTADAHPTTAGSVKRYAFGDSGAARQAFGGRTVEADLAFLLPHLRPGLRVVDCGCGAGGLTLQLGRLVAPGETVGFDLNSNAIAQAEHVLAAHGPHNVRFMIAGVHDVALPENLFDVAVFCGVLGHVPDPERALRHAFRIVKPGGLVAARELAKQGDWFGGPYWETVDDINRLHGDAIVAGGGDPFIGRRMTSLLAAAGFREVEAQPSYSPALSSVAVIGSLFLRRLQEQDFVAMAAARGSHSAQRLREMVREVDAWMTDPTSTAAISECIALGWKPGAD